MCYFQQKARPESPKPMFVGFKKHGGAYLNVFENV